MEKQRPAPEQGDAEEIKPPRLGHHSRGCDVVTGNLEGQALDHERHSIVEQMASDTERQRRGAQVNPAENDSESQGDRKVGEIGRASCRERVSCCV